MRLGEILIAAGLLSQEQLRQGLARQATSRGRLGTQLVQCGFATADQVALGLGKQHQVSPVLIRHFAHHDPNVVALISAKLAAEHFIVPIAYSRKGGTRSLVVCFRDPHNAELIARLQADVGLPVLPSVASELTIRIYLEKYYQVDALAAEGRPAPAEEDVDVDLSDFGEDEAGLNSFDLVELDHRSVTKSAPAIFVPESQRMSGIQEALRAAAAAVAAQASSASTSNGRELAPAPPPSVVPAVVAQPLAKPKPAPVSLDELLANMGAAETREGVSDSIMRFLEQRFAAGLMFTIKDGLAMGHRGFGGHLNDEDTVAALMLPLANSVLGLAHDSRELWRGDPASTRSAAQDRFLTLFAMNRAPSEVVVAPVAIGKKVLCLLYAHGENGGALSDPAVEELVVIASATNEAFARLIRNARKSGAKSM